MKITHLQANALFELSARFGVNLFALYPKLKKKKGSVKKERPLLHGLKVGNCGAVMGCLLH